MLRGTSIFICDNCEHIFKALDIEYNDYVKENLSKLELPEAHSTSIFLFDNFVRKWKNCFGADERKVMKYIPVAKI